MFQAEVHSGVDSLSKSLTTFVMARLSEYNRVLGKLFCAYEVQNRIIHALGILLKDMVSVCYGHLLNHLICDFKFKLLFIFLEGHRFMKEGSRGLVHTYRTWVFCQPLVKKKIPKHTSGVLKVMSGHVKITPKHEVIDCKP